MSLESLAQIWLWAWWHFRIFWIFWKTYFCKLVLGLSPDQNQTSAERLSAEWISIIIKKRWTSDSLSQGGAKTFERGRATFSKMPITPERNEISSPNSEHLCKSSIWGHRGNNHRAWPLGGAIRGKKHKNGYNCATFCPINMKVGVHGLGQMCHKCLQGHLHILKNMAVIGWRSLSTY